jgi:hypothetical protein
MIEAITIRLHFAHLFTKSEPIPIYSIPKNAQLNAIHNLNLTLMPNLIET